MNKTILFVCAFMLSFSSVYSQAVHSEYYDPPIPFNGTADWGVDYLVSNTEPMGKTSGVYRNSNSTIYVSVPDSNILPGKSIVIMTSTNNGINWSILASISPSASIKKTKMVGRTGSDSVYCIFLYGTTVYSWNVVTNFLNAFPTYTDINDFDATMSSTNSIYMALDRYINNDIRIYGSPNGGATWPGAVFLSSTGANANIYMSGTGDTCLITYYGVLIQPDTITSAIRSVRYRESAPGTLVVVGGFLTPLVAGTSRPQFKGVINGGKAWLIYSSGTAGSMDLNCIQSNDNGTTFGAPVTINSQPGRDEYWFDARHYTLGAGGIDIIYYSDSTGGPTNITDKLYYTLANSSSPTTFFPPVQISEHPPQASAIGYTPTLIEYYDLIGDLGALWVGLQSGSPKLYYDRYSAITHVTPVGSTIPEKFTLGQNYPNPFNPTTKINFSLPAASIAVFKIYDITGKEIAELIYENLQAGEYNIEWNASNYPSGTYFYKLTSGSFSQTKKMMLIK
ncbi:hypothetical protein BH10BAC5_BH10BAC5_02420 [soil metagenome]